MSDILEPAQSPEYLEAQRLIGQAAGAQHLDRLHDGTRGAVATLMTTDEEINRLNRHAVKTRDREQDIKLKLRLATFAIVAVSAQLLAANAFFGFYLVSNNDELSDQVMIGWLSATVVEVIGIVGIIAKNLFPDKSRRPKALRRSPAG